MVNFTIVVPVFNEKENLSRLETELMKFINSSKYKTKVLIINDGSTDGSKEIIENYAVKTVTLNLFHLRKIMVLAVL